MTQQSVTPIFTIGYGDRSLDEFIDVLRQHNLDYLIDVRSAQARLLPEGSGIGRLQTAFDRQLRVVLMCSEGKPEQCHRSKLISATLENLSIPVVHIDENDQTQSQETIILRLTDGQLSLFGEPEFHSRKRYRTEPSGVQADDDAMSEMRYDDEG